jgi:hypothetical protein
MGPKFPRNALHDCISRREGLLMHNKVNLPSLQSENLLSTDECFERKMMFVRPEKPINLPDGSDCTGWAYVGSANLSESAW